VDRALLWASGCAALGGGNRTVSSNELFLGFLLGHPDPRGEVWQLTTYQSVLPVRPLGRGQKAEA
jgi:hypothetical protein